jgi:hypothetical protein
MAVLFVLVAGARDMVRAGSSAESADETSTPAKVEEPAPEIDQMLAEWEKAASKIRRIDAQFTRFRYDRTFEVEKRGEGTIVIELPRRARYQLLPANIPPAAVGKRFAKGGDPFALNADGPECWHYTGTKLIKINEKERSYETIDVPANGRIQFFQEVDVLDTFFLARPFLVGMPAEELREQFAIDILKEAPGEIRLKLLPRQKNIAANIAQAILILDRETWLTKGMKIQDPTGAEVVHVFKNVRISGNPGTSDDLSEPNLDGYREVFRLRVFRRFPRPA